ncbi:unnamed protein product [Kluyveromyces dobzhanskii CBS 2104]|uniref:WGS project CCBQ000000000 data, contig 00012 n=1 Tax=Kluyveromyces dobzhanskii CBS 2104 TaxID=1427455 RepID=A0A0A8L2V7_9SACH|nr:unnamed protein product [Kluyveromyces dobzhanskii CBS 2104]
MPGTAFERAGLLNGNNSDTNTNANLSRNGNVDQTCMTGTSNVGQSSPAAPASASASASASSPSYSSATGAAKTSGAQSRSPSLNSANVESPSWKPMNPRVFDVYINDGSQKQKHLPDILDYKPPLTTENDSYVEGHSLTGPTVLINTGQGKKVSLPATANMVHKKQVPSLAANRTQSLSLSLEQHLSSKKSSPLTSSHTPLSNTNGLSNGPAVAAGSLSVPADHHMLQIRNSQSSHELPTPMSAMSLNPSTMSPSDNLNHNDKWAANVETAFINALQLVMKNGTAKIKLKENNFGRNELISIYIKHKTGEERSKKQISSHIQVWKKSIANKIHNDIHISDFETELLHLIEHGAEQTTANWEMFEKTFNEILDQDRADTDYSHQQQNMMPMNVGLQDQAAHMIQQQSLHQQQQQFHPSMQIPHAVFVPQNPGVPILPYHIPMMKEPATPIEFAQELYGSLKSFKCVPVNPYEHYNPYNHTPHIQQGSMHSPMSSSINGHQQQVKGSLPQLYSNGNNATAAHLNSPPTSSHLNSYPLVKKESLSAPSSSTQSLYQVAKEVENQQKKLIDELYQKQNTQQTPLLTTFHRTPNQSHQRQQADLSRRPPILPPASQLSASQSPVINNINPARS